MMRFLSIDLETTGLDPRYDEIIQFGCVLDEIGNSVPVSELPSFAAYIDRKRWNGQAFALQMNHEHLRRIAMKTPGYNYLEADQLGSMFRDWLLNQGFQHEKDGRIKVMCAGKNFGTFDMRFLCCHNGFTDFINMHQRVIDPATLFFDPSKDETLPNLATCLQRSGLPSIITHDAVDDARQVVSLLRYKWGY